MTWGELEMKLLRQIEVVMSEVPIPWNTKDFLNMLTAASIAHNNAKPHHNPCYTKEGA